MGRRKKNKRNPRGRGATTVALLVDGETESWYIEALKSVERLRNLKITPQLPKKSKLEDLYEVAKDLARIYDKVIWIIDLDVPIANGKKYGHLKQVMETFKRERTALEEMGVIAIVNTPSVEEWYMLHFEQGKKYFPSQVPLINTLKKNYINDYKKTEKFYKEPKENNFYQRLKPHLPKAIENSRKLPGFNPDEPERAACEMHKLFDWLKIK